MNRIEFMNRLSFLLSDIPENEREEAVQYYNDYLDDAGVENEEEVLRSLGRPEDLADSIRRGLLEESGEEGEFSETGYREKDCGNENEVARTEAASGRKAEGSAGEQSAGRQEERQAQGRTQEAGGPHMDRQPENQGAYRQSENRENQGAYRQSESRENKGAYRQPESHENRGAYRQSRDHRGYSRELDRRYRRGRKENRSGAMSPLVILLCILAAPVVLPVIFSLALVVVILAAVLIFLAVVFLMVGLICIVAGVVSFFGSIADIFTFPAGAVMALGISLITIGFGVLLTILLGWVLAKVFPKAFRSAADFCSGLFRKKGGNEG